MTQITTTILKFCSILIGFFLMNIKSFVQIKSLFPNKYTYNQKNRAIVIRTNMNKRICYYVTGHGLGHATRVVGLVQDLIKKGCSIVIVSSLDPAFFLSSIQHNGENLICHQRTLDVGAIQLDPLHVDAECTLSTYYSNIHLNRSHLISTEIEFLKNIDADLVCIDSTSIACVAAKSAGILSMIVSNLSWDFIYMKILEAIRHTLDEDRIIRYETMIDECNNDYGCADYYIQLPGTLPTPSTFHGISLSASMICRYCRHAPSVMRKMLGIPENVNILVFGFGGHKANWKLTDSMLPPNWICLVLAATSTEEMPSDRFIPVSYDAYIPDYIAVADVVLGKLGYGTVSECLVHGVPLMFVPRTHWPEEEFLEKLVNSYDAGVKLSEENFLSGNWRPSLLEALDKKGSWSVDNLHPQTAFDETSDLILNNISKKEKEFIN